MLQNGLGAGDASLRRSRPRAAANPVSTSSHEASLIGPAAAPLRALLPELLPGIELRSFDGVYDAIAAAALRPPDSLWLDVADLGRDDLGALRVVRHAFRQCSIVLLVSDWQQPGDLLPDAVALGCHTIRRPISVREVRLVLDRWQLRPARSLRGDLVAGLADQLNNPLAALVARLQLLALAQRQGDARDAADNLDLALRSAERMRRSLQKLELLSGRLQPVGQRLRALVVVAEALRDVPPARVVAPPESDAELVADPGSASLALARILAVCLDLSAAAAPVRVAIEPSTTACALTVVLGQPVPVPAPSDEILEPFRLHRVLTDPDLGLDLAVAQVLATAQDGHVQPVVVSGLLTGFQLVLPS